MPYTSFVRRCLEKGENKRKKEGNKSKGKRATQKREKKKGIL